MPEEINTSERHGSIQLGPEQVVVYLARGIFLRTCPIPDGRGQIELPGYGLVTFEVVLRPDEGIAVVRVFFIARCLVVINPEAGKEPDSDFFPMMQPLLEAEI